MTEQVDLDSLQQRIITARLALCESKRLIIAIAGAPGSGKSTLAEKLASQLNAHYSSQTGPFGAEAAVVVPMDGFHLDNAILDARNQRPVKGSPVTFDVAGFRDLLQRLRKPIESGQATDSPATSIYYPLFDRTMDLARVAAGCVENSDTIILVEGNYLLLQRSPWHELRDCFDLSVMLDVPLKVLEQRLVQRWLDHGLDANGAHERALTNDIPNAKVVLAESAAADVHYKSMRE